MRLALFVLVVLHRALTSVVGNDLEAARKCCARHPKHPCCRHVAPAPARTSEAHSTATVNEDCTESLRTWVFCATAGATPEWVDLTKRAVRSALRRTTLSLVCVFLGDAGDPLAAWLSAAGVRVLPHEPAWLPRIEAALGAAANARNRRASPLYDDVRGLAGTYLRLDIPLLLDPTVDGRCVLYSDADVALLRDPRPADFGPPGSPARAPRFFTAGAEIDGSDARRHNNGVLLINLEGLRRAHAALVTFAFSDDAVQAGLRYAGFGVVDQGAMAAFFAGRFDVAPWPLFNWKPYWPFDRRVALLHLHGPKPGDYRAWADGRATRGVFRDLLGRCADIDPAPNSNSTAPPRRHHSSAAAVRVSRDGTCAKWLGLYEGVTAVGVSTANFSF